MATDDEVQARLIAYFDAEARAVDTALAAMFGTIPKWVPAPSVDRAKRVAHKLLSDGFSAANLAQRVAEALRDELTFPGIVSDPAAFAQSIGELAHLKHAISLSEVEGLRLLSGEQAAHGQKFKARKLGSFGPIRKAVASLLKRNPEAKNSELWEAVKRRPPKGWQAFETPKLGKYLECPPKSMSYARFCNVCAEERKKQKGKITG